MRTLSAGLVGAGVEVTIVSVYPSGLDDDELARLGVPVVDLGRRGRGDRGYFRRLVETLRALRPDVVQAHLHTGQYGGRAAALIARVPALVLTLHGDEPGGPVRWAADRVLHAVTSRFVVFTEAQRRRFAAEERVSPDRISVIPNGVAVPPPGATRAEVRAALQLGPDAFAVYSAGRLSPEKNQRAAIDALAIALEAGADRLRLVLAGDGPLAAELRAFAAERGVAAQVAFLGYRRDAAALATSMDLFVLPSLRERMPLALGEAMMAGLAPVTTPWDGHDDFVRDGETGFVAAGFDGTALAATILRAYGDDALRVAIAQRAQTAARAMFDVGAMVRAHVALYESLARGRRT